MLILLPPSEGKAPPSAGPALDLSALSFPELTPTRERVVAALVRLCAERPAAAAEVLGLGPTQSGQVAVNAQLSAAHCSPAIDVYSGVLFEALGAATLSAHGRRRLDAHVAIASGLWGLVRPHDPIPAYRLSGSASLPDIGTLASAWRGPIGALLVGGEGLIVDLRSGTYQTLGPVPSDALHRTVTVRVLQELNGRRTVVSHSNKSTKGRIVRALLQSRRLPRTARDLHVALLALGFRSERAAPAQRPGPARIDVIVETP